MVLAQLDSQNFTFIALGSDNLAAYNALRKVVDIHLIKYGKIGKFHVERFWQQYPAEEIRYNEIELGQGFVQ